MIATRLHSYTFVYLLFPSQFVVIFGKVVAASSVDVIQSQIWRGFIMACGYALLANANGHCLAVTDKRLFWLNIKRNFLGTIMNVFMFFMLLKLPASLVSVIQMVNALVISYLDHILHGTEYSRWEIFYTITTIIGVIFIVNPGVILFWIDDPAALSADADKNYAQGTEKVLWICAYLVTIVLWSYSMVIIRQLKAVPITTMNFTFGFMLTMLASVTQLYNQGAAYIDPVMLAGIIFFLGIVSIVDQISFTRAFQIGKQGTLSVLKNVYVVFVLLYEIVYLKEYPSVYSMVGSFLILFSSVKLTLRRVSR